MQDQVNEALETLTQYSAEHGHPAEFEAAISTLSALAHPSRGVVDEVALAEVIQDHTGCGDSDSIYAAHAVIQHLQAAALPAVPERMALVPKHYAENVGYAAVMLEGSESAIDRLQAPALHALVKLLAATPAHDQPEGEEA